MPPTPTGWRGSTPSPQIARQFRDAGGRALQVIERGACYDPERRIVSGSRTLQEAARGRELPLAPITQRVKPYFPADVARLLAGAGLRSLQDYGGLDGSPATPASRLQVHVCVTV